VVLDELPTAALAAPNAPSVRSTRRLIGPPRSISLIDDVVPLAVPGATSALPAPAP